MCACCWGRGCDESAVPACFHVCAGARARGLVAWWPGLAWPGLVAIYAADAGSWAYCAAVGSYDVGKLVAEGGVLGSRGAGFTKFPRKLASEEVSAEGEAEGLRERIVMPSGRGCVSKK